MRPPGAFENLSPFAVRFGNASSGSERGSESEQKVVTAEPVMLDSELWPLDSECCKCSCQLTTLNCYYMNF